jgi:hypothetical protein
MFPKVTNLQANGGFFIDGGTVNINLQKPRKSVQLILKYLSLIHSFPATTPTLADIPILVQRLAHGVSGESDAPRVAAAQALLILLPTQDGRDHIVTAVVRANLVPHLVNLLNSNTLSQFVLRLLASILQFPQVQDAALKTPVIQLLVARLFNAAFVTQEDAACALAAITSSAEGKRDAVKAGAMQPLAGALRHHSQRTKKMAVRAVRNMASIEAGRQEAYSKNAVQPLVALLDSRPIDMQLHYDAVKALMYIASLNKSARRQMKEHGAFQKLKVYRDLHVSVELQEAAETLRDNLR